MRNVRKLSVVDASHFFKVWTLSIQMLSNRRNICEISEKNIYQTKHEMKIVDVVCHRLLDSKAEDFSFSHLYHILSINSIKYKAVHKNKFNKWLEKWINNKNGEHKILIVTRFNDLQKCQRSVYCRHLYLSFCDIDTQLFFTLDDWTAKKNYKISLKLIRTEL